MGVVRYTPAAEEDLYKIAVFTIKHWSVRQADIYIAELQDFCEFLADRPDIGRPCDFLAVGLKRIEHISHIIFFFIADDAITVARILHKSRDITDEEFDEFG